MKSPRVLHILPTLAPFNGTSGSARTGSLLCRALAHMGADVTVVAPAPREPERWGFARRLRPLAVPGDAGIIPVTVHEGRLAQGRVRAVLVQTEDIGVLCRAALYGAARKGRWPDVVHAGHGTELVPLLVKAGWLNQATMPATVFTLNNLSVRGGRNGGIDRRASHVRDALAAASNHGVAYALAQREHALAIALACSDHIVVESQTCAAELLTADASNGHAMRLTDVSDRFRFAASGVDDQRWHFDTDTAVAGHPHQTLLQRKALTKLQLQRELGLTPHAHRPLIAVIGPHEHVDADTATVLSRTAGQFVFMLDGQRDAHLAPTLRSLPRHRVAARFSETSSLHQLIAAADFVLMPHQYEATKPSQLHCWHYGAIPIVPRMGAFADRIVQLDSDTATGNGLLYTPTNAGELVATLKHAARLFGVATTFARIRMRLSQADVSWRPSARQHLALYRSAAGPT